MKMVGLVILKCLAKAIACKRQHPGGPSCGPGMPWMLQKNLSWKPGLWSLKFQRGKYQKKSEGNSSKNYLNFLTETVFFGRYFRMVCSSQDSLEELHVLLGFSFGSGRSYSGD